MNKNEFMKQVGLVEDLESINFLVNNEENWTEITLGYEGIGYFIDSDDTKVINKEIKKIRNWLKGTYLEGIEIKVEEYIC